MTIALCAAMNSAYTEWSEKDRYSPCHPERNGVESKDLSGSVIAIIAGANALRSFDSAPFRSG